MIGRAYEWELEAGLTGWQYYKLPSPVALKAGKRYIAGVTNGSNGYSFSWSGNFFTSTVETGSLMTCEIGVRWREMYINGAGFPDLTTASNYFRDVVFVADTELFFELSMEEKPPAVGWLNCGRFLSKIYKLTT